jgi:hypothetical protein
MNFCFTKYHVVSHGFLNLVIQIVLINNLWIGREFDEYYFRSLLVNFIFVSWAAVKLSLIPGAPGPATVLLSSFEWTHVSSILWGTLSLQSKYNPLLSCKSTYSNPSHLKFCFSSVAVTCHLENIKSKSLEISKF